MFTHLRPVFVAGVALLAGLSAQTSISGSFSKSIGNSYLGGSVSASASLSASTSLSGSAADAAVNLGVHASVLTHSLTVAQLDFNAHNDISRQFQSIGGGFFRPFTVQTARASLRLKFAGIQVDRSLTATGNLGGIPVQTIQLFPQDVAGDIPAILGITVRLSGNAGITFGAGANVILPTGVAEVRPAVSAQTAVVARARVAAVFKPFGVSIAGVGVEVRGTFAETRITGGMTASATNGLSGFLNFQMRAIRVLISIFGELFGFQKTLATPVDWSFGVVDRDLISL